jgi:hypothetical protein
VQRCCDHGRADRCEECSNRHTSECVIVFQAGWPTNRSHTHCAGPIIFWHFLPRTPSATMATGAVVRGSARVARLSAGALRSSIARDITHRGALSGAGPAVQQRNSHGAHRLASNAREEDFVRTSNSNGRRSVAAPPLSSRWMSGSASADPSMDLPRGKTMAESSVNLGRK